MIIVRSYNPAQHGHSVRSPYELFADTKNEVPETGTATKALISDFPGGSIPPTTLLITGDWNIAHLGTDDKWSWIDA